MLDNLHKNLNLEKYPNLEVIRLEEVDSTNNFLRNFQSVSPRPVTLAIAEYQCAGRGQRGNSWESERGKNLVFSMLVHPHLPVSRIFALSEVCALAIRDAIGAFVEPIEVKWPNDIYWNDRKIAGILIETTLTGKMIEDAILGVGVNINQEAFLSDAPNPVSLRQILGREEDRMKVLDKVVENFSANMECLQREGYDELHTRYMQSLYRREGYHPYRDEGGEFLAEIVGVEPSGHLLLKDADGCQRRYAFKEVETVKKSF